MNEELININIQFLQRTTLSPSEIPAFNALLGALEKERIALKNAADEGMVTKSVGAVG